MIDIKKSYATSGIYEIINTINNKRYIGQSQNMYIRIRHHINYLRSNIHNNKHLQAAWNQYGEDSFACSVLEFCGLEQLNERELFWITYFSSNNNDFGYNIRIDPFSNRGLKWTDEQRAKMMELINDENSWYKNHTMSREIMEKAWKTNRNRVWTKEDRERQSKRLKGIKTKDTTKMKAAQQGEKNGCAKLTQKEVEEIIYFLSIGQDKMVLANLYHVSYSNIRAINEKRSWAFLDHDKIKFDKEVECRARKKVNL